MIRLIASNGCLSDTSELWVQITISSTSENQNSMKYVFPNPTHQIVCLSPAITNKGEGTIQITGVAGRVWKKAFIQRDSDQCFDVSNLPKGAYFILVDTGGSMHREMFIKN